MDKAYALLHFGFAACGVALSLGHPVCGTAVVLGSLAIGAAHKALTNSDRAAAHEAIRGLKEVVNGNAKTLEGLLSEFEAIKSAQAINMRANGLGMPPLVAPFPK